MPFTPRLYLAQSISSAAFDPTLRHPVRPRTSKGGPRGVHYQGSNGGRDFQSVLGIPIEDQNPECRLQPKRLPRLRHNPPARRMPGDGEVENTPPVVADDPEAVEHTEGDHRNCTEIHRGPRRAVISKQSEPALAGRRGPSGSFDPRRDGSLGMITGGASGGTTTTPKRAVDACDEVRPAVYNVMKCSLIGNQSGGGKADDADPVRRDPGLPEGHQGQLHGSEQA